MCAGSEHFIIGRRRQDGSLLRELWQLREIQELAQLMESGGGPALVTGLSPVHRAMTAGSAAAEVRAAPADALRRRGGGPGGRRRICDPSPAGSLSC